MYKRPPHNIFIFEEVFKDDECAYLIECIEKYMNDGPPSGSKSHVKARYIYSIQIPDIEEMKKVDKMIYNCVHKIAEELTKHNIYIRGDEPYNLRKIYGATSKHTDGIYADLNNRDVNKTRNMSLIISLNSDYEGGEICFPEQDLKFKLKRGQAIAFPPYWTHPHYTNDVNGTFRYTVNTWLHGS